MKLKNVWLILLLALSVQGFAQVKKYIRKAENAIYTGHYYAGRDYYLQALAIDKDNYKANLGAGLAMAYYLEDFDGCLPYLENALRLSPKKDASIELYYALGKTYHYLGRYSEALQYYQQMLEYDEPDNAMYQPELGKRMEDCKYAMAHPQYTDPGKWYVVNAGKTINTPMPEYVPVLIGDNRMIFTSKRKDNEKERINRDNGKYFESMYITDISNGYTSSPSRYSIPAISSKPKSTNSNESVISLMPGGQKIFIYKDQKLYEGDLVATTKEPDKISKTINFDRYQNHAVIGEAGDVLYFTSESEQGRGGNDIYRSVKQADGSWGAPENLGEAINTIFDEEAPFISDDGKTLFFASNGLPGYGGFDIYKSTYENGKWSTPVNMGQPVNSPANDLFYVGSSDGTVGYMSSSRKGGQGDMDIYKINYTDKLPRNCNNNLAPGFAIDLKESSPNSNLYTLSARVPDEIKDKIISFDLRIGDSLIKGFDKAIEYDFKKKGTYHIEAKVVAWCDTCINLYIACTERQLEITHGEEMAPLAGTMDAGRLDSLHGELSMAVLDQMGFDGRPLYFDKNSAGMKAESEAALEKNIELLKKYPGLVVVVNGYADSKGSEEHNKMLSKQRADVVKRYLLAKGVKNRVETYGKGETELVNNCGNDADCDEAMHQQNRRVELRIRKK
jgi:outer membrane protein OmpA-like peptidoglycan-associated protein/tetratricopeptide (TPR) repeat protein